MGAYAFYLAVRFYMTDEFKFSSATVADKFFCDNKNWFDTKLLVDCYSNDYCKEMSNDSYSRFMKRIAPQTRWGHLRLARCVRNSHTLGPMWGTNYLFRASRN
jgi:hypothetical protein